MVMSKPITESNYVAQPMQKVVHVVYIHGFQGNDTSFQSFPLHLQEKLSSRIPPDLNIRFQSSLYPTYKSVKPLSHATKNFLGWLATQPDGPVILIGHSMGGLLAAEAATDPSHRNGQHPTSKPKRIVGVVAFDTPFLGMHPHVVVSGIASLLPKDDNAKASKTEKELNQHPQIQIVDTRATDEWEDFKKQMYHKSRSRLEAIDKSHLVVAPSLLSTSTSSLPDSLSSHSIEIARNRSPSPLFAKAVDFLASHTKEDDPLVRWLRKHADHPLSAGKRWVTERFQFGSSMFDPAGLKDRYSKLVEWNGLWINYWTYTTDSHQENTAAATDKVEKLSNDIALLDTGIDGLTSGHSKASGSANDSGGADERHRALRKQRQSALDQIKEKPSIRHFIVLPTGLGRVLGGWEKWEKVAIAGVEDEVAAHTGLFIPQHNLDYANFVDRVADRVFDWCQQM